MYKRMMFYSMIVTKYLTHNCVLYFNKFRLLYIQYIKNLSCNYSQVKNVIKFDTYGVKRFTFGRSGNH